MKIAKSKYLLIFIGIMVLFSGCSQNYENINPTPNQVNVATQESVALRDLYEKQAFLKGEEVGFQKGLEFSKMVIEELLNDLRAKQFSIYLYKERYIEAGPIYMNPTTGEIELGKMEIRRPFTVADIFNQYGAEIPLKSEKKIKTDLENIEDEIKQIQSSVSPDIFKSNKTSGAVNGENINGYIVKMYNTKSNVDILTGFGYNYGVIDDKLILKFQDKNRADTFCKNFACILD